MDFKLKINLDNDEYKCGTEEKTSEILKMVASMVVAGLVGSNIRDINGNIVGKWEFTDY